MFCKPESINIDFAKAMPLQELLAARCGGNPMDVARQIKTIYDNYYFKTEIIVAAVRHPTHVLEAALDGAHICTMSYDLMVQLYGHPLTDIGIDLFLKDWAKVPK